jgi:putative spermidine/putrescine transport system permease protein
LICRATNRSPRFYRQHITQAARYDEKTDIFTLVHYSRHADRSRVGYRDVAVMQFSVRAYIPGSLDVGGFTLANFNSLFKSIYADAFINTVMLSAKTAFFGLLMSYPLAYALVRTRTWGSNPRF